MNNPRTFLLVALFALTYLIYSQWQLDYNPPAGVPATVATTSDTGKPAVAAPAATASADVPQINAGDTGGTAASVPLPPTLTDAASRVEPIVVTTDLLRVEIDLHGGNVVSAELLAYPVEPKQPQRVRLFDTDPASFFIAQSGLLSADGAAPNHNAEFTASSHAYSLADGQTRLEVPLTWQDASGIRVTKTYVFARGSYVIEQNQQVDNASAKEWTGQAYRQLQRVPLVLDHSGIKGYTNTARYSFMGAAWYSPEEKFQKLAFDKFSKEPLKKDVTGGWVALLQHYFFAAWIPPADEKDQFQSDEVSVAGATRYLVRSASPVLKVAPGAQQSFPARLYVGPKLQSTLDDLAPGLAKTADYGIFTVISEPLHWLLSMYHRLTGNWGFAIILLVLTIKAVFFKLSEAQYRSMARMRKMQPRVAALKERYGDDRQKMNQAMLELYQKEKINPLGGCLPMLVQIPVFLGLYWVLLESVELRQAPFMLWIHNLTAPDPYYVLPILNAATMLATQMLTPMTGMDPLQAKMMKFMPLIFSVLFAFFPAGLVLYWTVNGALGLLQQWIITRRIESGEKTLVPAKGK
ncbi:MAG: membrane protein insertase YidC [Dokdonella sp.]|uniref:membrane protein insertase YidC n=1 Tax=Dokdonella sp. TaxID=2291710 RepID=UPI002D06957A|nr:membrane protein insertase YidC [Dokdonella sp.]HOX71777.1 membrane protein insertase YidC [Dokdonella sp.]HPG93180.1 membrane protein insertase YidC [Dokdonella sp.]HPN78121.1 membrane protein insertase YidC [Dokdonella sp.]